MAKKKAFKIGVTIHTEFVIDPALAKTKKAAEQLVHALVKDKMHFDRYEVRTYPLDDGLSPKGAATKPLDVTVSRKGMRLV